MWRRVRNRKPDRGKRPQSWESQAAPGARTGRAKVLVHLAAPSLAPRRWQTLLMHVAPGSFSTVSASGLSTESYSLCLGQKATILHQLWDIMRFWSRGINQRWQNQKPELSKPCQVFFLIMLKYTLKFTILAFLIIQLSGIRCIHTAVRTSVSIISSVLRNCNCTLSKITSCLPLLSLVVLMPVFYVHAALSVSNKISQKTSVSPLCWKKGPFPILESELQSRPLGSQWGDWWQWRVKVPPGMEKFGPQSSPALHHPQMAQRCAPTGAFHFFSPDIGADVQALNLKNLSLCPQQLSAAP